MMLKHKYAHESNDGVTATQGMVHEGIQLFKRTMKVPVYKFFIIFFRKPSSSPKFRLFFFKKLAS